MDEARCFVTLDTEQAEQAATLESGRAATTDIESVQTGDRDQSIPCHTLGCPLGKNQDCGVATVVDQLGRRVPRRAAFGDTCQI